MSSPLLLVTVGNTRTRYAPVREGVLDPASSFHNDQLDTEVEGLLEAASNEPGATVLVSSVNSPVATRIHHRLGESDRDLKILRLGQDVPLDVPHALTPPLTVGQDRLLAALGAFSRSEQACIVIDAGTAITVDFIDGHGVFQGGAIAPGVRLMLRSLHEHTAALPLIDFSPSQVPPAADDDGGPDPFGKTTASAMILGAISAARGLAHHLIDRYAQFYKAYPRVVATGGDAPMLFENDPLVEHIVPDLVLIGMLTAWQMHVAEEQDADQL